MDHYASDASAVVESLDLRNAVHVGHSTGGGQVARYVAEVRPASEGSGQSGTGQRRSSADGRQTRTPAGAIEVFDGFRQALAITVPVLPRHVAGGPFYGFNRDGAEVSQGAQSRTGGVGNDR